MGWCVCLNLVNHNFSLTSQSDSCKIHFVLSEVPPGGTSPIGIYTNFSYLFLACIFHQQFILHSSHSSEPILHESMNLLPPRPPITDNADDRPMRQVSYMLPSGYSLTWPIWHRMSHAEKLKIARSENLTIGAFEEEVALFMAIEEDTASADRAENSPALDTNISEAVSMTTTEEPSSLLEKHRLKLEGFSISFGNDDENDDANQESVPVDSVQVKRAEPQAPDPLPSSPDLLTSLPVDVIIYSLLPFLPTTNIVKHLPCAHRFFSALLSPPLYKMLCRRRFNTPNLPKKFNTYKQMYHSRPHPLHYGVYTMRCSYVKKITRDMWTSSSLPPGVILKGEWFHHIVFLEATAAGICRRASALQRSSASS